MITKVNLYNKEIEVFFDSLRHRYSFEDGIAIPSVTGILGIIAKPALVNWSANMVADSVASSLKPGVAYDEIEIQSIVETARKSHFQKKVDAANIGTFVHHWVEQRIKGENPGIPVNEKLANSCLRFVDWIEEHNVKFLASEQIVYSREFNYIGTLDFICQIGKKLYIGDLKTSSGIWDEYKLQVAAYRHARVEEFPSEKYFGQLIVRVGKEGDFEFKIIDGDDNYQVLFNAFKEALGLSRAMEKVKEVK